MLDAWRLSSLLVRVNTLQAISPWNTLTPAPTPMEPHRPRQQHASTDSQKKQHRPAPPVAPQKISIGPIRPVKVPWLVRDRDSFKPNTPIVPALSSRPEQTAPRHALKIAKAGWSRADRLNAKPVVRAYQELLKQTETMSAENNEKRRMDDAAYRMGLANISDEMVRKQKDLIRFHTFKNEVDIFQQHLVPFIFDIRSERERQVNSSVYRHFNRMRAIQDMGIPIYSLGDYLFEDTDRIITARTKNTLYRRVRRRSAAHFIDTELIPRPERRRGSVVLSPSFKED
ncbi:unnamed protein product [Phytophthora lilii]|uniref:Unnamed protein product n=1 Tax=Phytophthora lilii TaxID=2077276 RepID=A0A9W6U8C7_9STRA|nr:unnamed protein product [Phytophthora lilii]